MTGNYVNTGILLPIVIVLAALAVLACFALRKTGGNKSDKAENKAESRSVKPENEGKERLISSILEREARVRRIETYSVYNRVFTDSAEICCLLMGANHELRDDREFAEYMAESYIADIPGLSAEGFVLSPASEEMPSVNKGTLAQKDNEELKKIDEYYSKLYAERKISLNMKSVIEGIEKPLYNVLEAVKKGSSDIIGIRRLIDNIETEYIRNGFKVIYYRDIAGQNTNMESYFYIIEEGKVDMPCICLDNKLLVRGYAKEV